MPAPDLFGPELHDFMKRAARGFTRIGMFGEEMPNIENRIELASDKDEFGMPLGRIIHSFDQDAVALWNANFEEGLKIAKAAGAKEVWVGARRNIRRSTCMGGTIMGTDAANSVVNSYGQTHELPNLYVAGPGIFPTEGASNPTYTIFAAVAARRRATGGEMEPRSRGEEKKCRHPGAPRSGFPEIGGPE